MRRIFAGLLAIALPGLAASTVSIAVIGCGGAQRVNSPSVAATKPEPAALSEGKTRSVALAKVVSLSKHKGESEDKGKSEKKPKTPEFEGIVTAVSGNTITIQDKAGATRTVNVTASTTYEKDEHATGALADVTVGLSIEAKGALAADGSLTATRVEIETPKFKGIVTAVNGNAITIQDKAGATRTVNVTPSTTYEKDKHTSATIADISVGVSIEAKGVLSTDGNSITATTVKIKMRKK